MEIGEVKRTRIIHPLENPVPQPKRVEEPAPLPVLVPEREKVPVPA